jgi:hypothetical protein
MFGIRGSRILRTKLNHTLKKERFLMSNESNRTKIDERCIVDLNGLFLIISALDSCLNQDASSDNETVNWKWPFIMFDFLYQTPFFSWEQINKCENYIE